MSVPDLAPDDDDENSKTTGRRNHVIKLIIWDN